jgi:hypothetical protein
MISKVTGSDDIGEKTEILRATFPWVDFSLMPKEVSFSLSF